MAMLQEKLPHVDLTPVIETKKVSKLAGIVTVDSIVNFVERKLAAAG